MKNLLISLMLCCGFAQAAAQTLKSGVFDPPRVAPEIGLPASNGKPFKLLDYRGKVVVLAFGFSHCEYVCPVSLAALAQARAQLGSAGRDVQVVFISVDPERDSPERLRTWLAQFDKSFVGVTGTPAQISQLLKNYGITASRRPVEGGKEDRNNYTMNHSSYLYFIDRQGRQRAMMPFGRPAADIAHDLAILQKR